MSRFSSPPSTSPRRIWSSHTLVPASVSARSRSLTSVATLILVLPDRSRGATCDDVAVRVASARIRSHGRQSEPRRAASRGLRGCRRERRIGTGRSGARPGRLLRDRGRASLHPAARVSSDRASLRPASARGGHGQRRSGDPGRPVGAPARPAAVHTLVADRAARGGVPGERPHGAPPGPDPGPVDPARRCSGRGSPFRRPSSRGSGGRRGSTLPEAAGARDAPDRMRHQERATCRLFGGSSLRCPRARPKLLIALCLRKDP